MNSMPTPPTAYDETAKGPGLSGLLEILRRRRVLAVLPFLFVLTAAVSLAVFLPSLWTARSLVLVNRQAIPERYVTPTVQADIEARLLTLSQEILTPERLTQIARQYGLYRNARSTDELVDRMRKDIRIELMDQREQRGRESRSFLFTVSYTAANPVVAARVANTLSSLYIEENGRQREQAAASTSEFLGTQLRDLREKLQTQERQITAYKEKNLGELPEQKDVNLRTLERLQQQLQLAHENNRRASEPAPPGAGHDADALQRQVPRRRPAQGADPRAGGEGGGREAGRGRAAQGGRRAEADRARPARAARERLRGESDDPARPGDRRSQDLRRGDPRHRRPDRRLHAPAREHAQARAGAGDPHPRLRHLEGALQVAAHQARRGRHGLRAGAAAEGRELPRDRGRAPAGAPGGSEPVPPAAGGPGPGHRRQRRRRGA